MTMANASIIIATLNLESLEVIKEGLTEVLTLPSHGQTRETTTRHIVTIRCDLCLIPLCGDTHELTEQEELRLQEIGSQTLLPERFMFRSSEVTVLSTFTLALLVRTRNTRPKGEGDSQHNYCRT